MVRNRSGRFVSPDLERIGTAADAAPSRIAEDFQTSIVEGADTDAYSIASFSWFIVPAKFEDAGRKESMKKLPTWIYWDRGRIRLPPWVMSRCRSLCRRVSRECWTRSRTPQVATLFQIITMVSPIMMMLVAQAIELPHGPLRYSPISRSLLTSFSMNTRTNGSRTPLAT